MNKDTACSWLFSQLQSMEPLLCGGHRVRITRTVERKIGFAVLAIGESKAAWRTTLDPATQSEAALLAQVDEVWRGLVQQGLTIYSEKQL